MDDFFMTLPSNTRTGAGTASHFHVNLPTSLDLEGDWSVALVELMYPVTWNTITNCYITVRWYDRPPTDKARVALTKRIRVPDSHYTDVKQVIAAINRSYRITMHRLLRFYETSDTIPPIEKAKLADRYRTISRAFSVEWREPAGRAVVAVKDPIIHVELDRQLIYTLGFKNRYRDYYPEGRYVAAGPPDLKSGLSALHVYLPIIRPVIVGDSQVCLLKVVPTKGNFGEQTLDEFPNLQYYPLAVRRFASLEVSINTASGAPVSFAYGSVYLKLHFKRVM